uniref:Uncharacterized protein n=1 Tax=Anguilla anguilla TaxID=7936 RepID=A0A0E9RV11_ANGAN
MIMNTERLTVQKSHKVQLLQQTYLP